MKITTVYCDMPGCESQTGAESGKGWTVWIGKFTESSSPFGQYHVCPLHDAVLPQRPAKAVITPKVEINAVKDPFGE